MITFTPLERDHLIELLVYYLWHSNDISLMYFLTFDRYISKPCKNVSKSLVFYLLVKNELRLRQFTWWPVIDQSAMYFVTFGRYIGKACKNLSKSLIIYLYEQIWIGCIPLYILVCRFVPLSMSMNIVMKWICVLGKSWIFITQKRVNFDIIFYMTRVTNIILLIFSYRVTIPIDTCWKTSYFYCAIVWLGFE